jgi:EAL domain-containing protein (putative c-di-GMP-specific phosphodiesterase class I)
MEVVAEGVESEEALEELRELGCTLAQGYAISPPLSGDALRAWADGRGVGSEDRTRL